MNRELFKDKKVRTKYLDVMAASVIIFDPSFLARIQAYRDMSEVLKFEEKLIEVLTNSQDFFAIQFIRLLFTTRSHFVQQIDVIELHFTIHSQ